MAFFQRYDTSEQLSLEISGLFAQTLVQHLQYKVNDRTQSHRKLAHRILQTLTPPPELGHIIIFGGFQVITIFKESWTPIISVRWVIKITLLT